MTPAERIIGKFGSLGALARALGHRNTSTVQGWKERGIIPVRHASDIQSAARAVGIAVTAEDFLPTASPSSASESGVQAA